MKSKNSGKSMKSGEKRHKFGGKRILAAGLVALVLAAGYYRWTVGTIDPEAVSVSNTAMPTDDGTETFWSSNNNENNNNENSDNKNGEDENNNDNNNTNDGENTGENSQGSDEGNTGTEDQGESKSADVIASARRDRDELRGETMDKWKEISENKDASENAKKEAEDNILKLTEYSENENNIETNVKSKGFDDCFAQVSDSGVSVIVDGGNLDSASVAQIKDIIITETGVAASQIKISAGNVGNSD